MKVARQFIAWNLSKNATRPVGTVRVGYTRRIHCPAKKCLTPHDHTVPYGTELVCYATRHFVPGSPHLVLSRQSARLILSRKTKPISPLVIAHHSMRLNRRPFSWQ